MNSDLDLSNRELLDLARIIDSCRGWPIYIPADGVRGVLKSAELVRQARLLATPVPTPRTSE